MDLRSLRQFLAVKNQPSDFIGSLRVSRRKFQFIICFLIGLEFAQFFAKVLAAPRSLKAVSHFKPATILSDVVIPFEGSVRLALHPDFLGSRTMVHGVVKNVEGILTQERGSYLFTRLDQGESVSLTAQLDAFYPVFLLNSIDDLRTRHKPADVEKVKVLGYNKPDDGAGGIFSAIRDTATPDNRGTIIVDVQGTRWKRNYTHTINAKWFGLATNNSGSANTNALSAAIDWAIAQQEPLIISNEGTPYLLAARTIAKTIPDGRKLVIQGENNPRLIVSEPIITKFLFVFAATLNQRRSLVTNLENNSITATLDKSDKLTSGNLFVLRTNQQPSKLRSSQKNDVGLIKKVETNQVTFSDPTNFSYNLSDPGLTTDFYHPASIRIEGLNFEITHVQENGNAVLRLNFLQQCEISNCHFKYLNPCVPQFLDMVGLFFCYDCLCKNLVIEGGRYGVLLGGGTRKVVVDNIKALLNRHAVSPHEFCSDIYASNIYGYRCVGLIDGHFGIRVHYANVLSESELEHSNMRNIGGSVHQAQFRTVNPDFSFVFGLIGLTDEYAYLENVDYVLDQVETNGQILVDSLIRVNRFTISNSKFKNFKHAGSYERLDLKFLEISNSNFDLISVRKIINSIKVLNSKFQGIVSENSVKLLPPIYLTHCIIEPAVKGKPVFAGLEAAGTPRIFSHCSLKSAALTDQHQSGRVKYKFIDCNFTDFHLIASQTGAQLPASDYVLSESN